MQIKVGFSGMTHLGLNYAAAIAEKGFSTICYDDNPQLIQDLRSGILSVEEPGLLKSIQKNQKNILFTTNLANDLALCDIIYIASDVPTDNAGNSDLLKIQQLIANVLQVIKQDAILIVLCQVPPGFTRNLNFDKHRLYYQVETLVFGQALVRALNPERFIIGCNNTDCSIANQYKRILEAFNCPILTMSYESAELAKIAINCYLVSSISVANTLSEICELIGANWSEIVPALKLDKRIGQNAYLKPGLGIAGGNLERDLRTVLELSNIHGSYSGLIKEWIANSQYQLGWVVRKLHERCLSRDYKKIAILGLSYKEDTNSIKNSPAIYLLNILTNNDSLAISVYDPIVRLQNFPMIKQENSITNLIANSEVLIIMTPWQEFKQINLQNFEQIKMVIDPYQVLKHTENKKENFEYITLGHKINDKLYKEKLEIC